MTQADRAELQPCLFAPEDVLPHAVFERVLVVPEGMKARLDHTSTLPAEYEGEPPCAARSVGRRETVRAGHDRCHGEEVHRDVDQSEQERLLLLEGSPMNKHAVEDRTSELAARSFDEA